MADEKRIISAVLSVIVDSDEFTLGNRVAHRVDQIGSAQRAFFDIGENLDSKSLNESFSSIQTELTSIEFNSQIDSAVLDVGFTVSSDYARFSVPLPKELAQICVNLEMQIELTFYVTRSR